MKTKLNLFKTEILNKCSSCGYEANLFEVRGIHNVAGCSDSLCKNSKIDQFSQRRIEAIAAWNNSPLSIDSDE